MAFQRERLGSGHFALALAGRIIPCHKTKDEAFCHNRKVFFVFRGSVPKPGISADRKNSADPSDWSGFDLLPCDGTGGEYSR